MRFSLRRRLSRVAPVRGEVGTCPADSCRWIQAAGRQGEGEEAPSAVQSTCD